MQHLYVTNLTRRWTHESLLKLFDTFGKVLDLTWTAETGCAFVEYSQAREAELAVEQLHGREFYDHNISVIQAEKPLSRTSVSSQQQHSQALHQPDLALLSDGFAIADSIPFVQSSRSQHSIAAALHETGNRPAATGSTTSISAAGYGKDVADSSNSNKVASSTTGSSDATKKKEPSLQQQLQPAPNTNGTGKNARLSAQGTTSPAVSGIMGGEGGVGGSSSSNAGAASTANVISATGSSKSTAIPSLASDVVLSSNTIGNVSSVAAVTDMTQTPLQQKQEENPAERGRDASHATTGHADTKESSRHDKSKMKHTSSKAAHGGSGGDAWIQGPHYQPSQVAHHPGDPSQASGMGRHTARGGSSSHPPFPGVDPNQMQWVHSQFGQQQQQQQVPGAALRGSAGMDSLAAHGPFENMQKQMESALPVAGSGNAPNSLATSGMDRPQHMTLEYNQPGSSAYSLYDYTGSTTAAAAPAPGAYQTAGGSSSAAAGGGGTAGPGGDHAMQFDQHGHPHSQQSFHHFNASSPNHQHHQPHQQQQQRPPSFAHSQQQQQPMRNDYHGVMQTGFEGYGQPPNYPVVGGHGFIGNGAYGNGRMNGGNLVSSSLGRSGSVSSNGPLDGSGPGSASGQLLSSAPGQQQSAAAAAAAAAAGATGSQSAGHSHCDFPLRILVPSEMIGAIIGKEGHTIRAITEHTGARVDVHRKENPGAAEKAITIIGTPDACSAASKSIGEIMQKEAMTNSSFHTDKCQGPHGNLPCIALKILAHNNLVGRVIGKNGNTLKKIMSESDTKITISKLSELTAANMERTITVVGTIICSSNAESLISMKLRASYECDMNHLIPQQHPLPSPMYPSTASSVRQSSSTPVSPGIVSPDLMMGGGFADDAAYLQSPSATGGSASAAAAAGTSAQIEIVHLAVPSTAVGAIIGTKGKEIRNISQLSGATLRISRSCDDSTERIVTIQGHQEAQWAAQNCIYNKVREECFPNQSGGDEMQLRVELTVPAGTVGRIIGKGGTAVRELQRKTGAMVEVPRGQQSENVTVRILGNFHSSQVAQRHIKEIVSQAQHQQEQQQQHEQQHHFQINQSASSAGAAGTGAGGASTGATAGGSASLTSQGAQSPAQHMSSLTMQHQQHSTQQPQQPQAQQQQQSAYHGGQQYFTFAQTQAQPPLLQQHQQQQQQQQHMLSWQSQWS